MRKLKKGPKMRSKKQAENGVKKRPKKGHFGDFREGPKMGSILEFFLYGPITS